MGKIVSIVVLAAIMFSGFNGIVSHFSNPEYVDITIEEIDSIGTEGLEYVNIIGGISGGDYITKESKSGGTTFSVKYPLMNLKNLTSDVDTSRLRTKVIVYDSKADSASLSMENIKGKVDKDGLTSEELNLLRASYVIESDYIVVKKNWKKPGFWIPLLMIIIPGLLLFYNLRIFFTRRS